MAIPVNIGDLIHQRVVESTRIEYKADFNPDPIIRSICAFANDIDNMGGGYIIVGVEENNGAPQFPIKGIEQSRIDGIQKKLREYCHYIEPLYEPVVERILYHDVYVIVIWVSGGYGRPYKAPKEVTSKYSNKYYYIRKFANSVIASNQEEKELFYASSNIPFDDRPNLAADVSDLNVGLLMFSERPERYFRYARIEVVDIPDPTGTNMIEKIFTGPIQRQLKDALQYLKNYTIKEVVIKTQNKAEAIRISNYPYAAIEEILANAVYHRSYQINEPITVRITPESIEITSFPGFDRSITDEAISKLDIRARMYRNRRIGDFLKELKLIEGRNTGFPNAKKALELNGSPSLQFEMNPERDYLSVIIPVHSYFLQKSEKSEKQIAYENQLLECLTTPFTLTELAHAMGYKSISQKLRNTLTELQNLGKVKAIVVDKSVKYIQ